MINVPHVARCLIVYGDDHPRSADPVPPTVPLVPVWFKVVNLGVTLKYLQSIVGGNIEAFSPPHVGAGADWSGYCDEEGKVKERPVNVRATDLARAAGWLTGDVLCGTVIFFGEPDDDGKETDVPVWFLKLARNVLGDEVRGD